MKTEKTAYIVGNIEERPIEDMLMKFMSAKRFLKSMGYHVVNPIRSEFSILNKPILQRIKKYIINLAKCDTVYLLDDWEFSEWSSIEYYIALTLGKNILYESEELGYPAPINVVTEVKQAVHKVTGLQFNEYANNRMVRSLDARLLFVAFCDHYKVKPALIESSLRITHATHLRIKRQYNDAIHYDKYFRDKAMKIKQLLANKIGQIEND
jgi:hypothetical protein